MRLAHREASRLETVRSLNANFFNALRGQAISVAVFVSEWTCRIVKRFHVDIRQIGGIVSAHPAAVFVMSDVRQRKTKACVAGEIPTFVAVNVTFINLTRTEERQVRIDEKHRVAGRAF